MLKKVEADTPVRITHRYAALDGLRGVAAYSVVISHYGATVLFDGLISQVGQIGVMLFFVISGLLMGRLYMKSPFSGAAVRDFYVKRIARVIPLYYLVVFASFTLFMTRHSVWPLFYVSDADLWRYAFFWQGRNILWTVPVEVQFYALFPVFWWVFSKIGTAVAFLILTVCAVVALTGFTGWPIVIGFLPFFMAGLLISMVDLPYSKVFEPLLICALVALVIALPKVSVAFGILPTGLWNSPVYLLLIPTTVLLALNSRWADAVLGSRAATFAGTISYSVYLLHMPAHFVLRQLHIYEISPLLFICIALVGTTAVSWLSFTLIENPSRRWVTARLR
jgi:peptidoglycan/LPS O-acetylase OafA/YrhL